MRAQAFQTGWTPSTEFQATYVIGEALPTVVATVTPEANGFGWHGSDVIVSFTCSAPSGIASCSDPTSVRAYAQDYPETVTGTGVSTTGLVGSTTITLRFDIEPPRVDIYEPAAGSDVPEVTTAVTVRGGLHDGPGGHGEPHRVCG